MVKPTSPARTRPLTSLVLTSSVPRPSIPVDSCGTRGSENARRTLLVMIALLAWLAWSFHLPWPAWVGIAVVAALLAYEHSLVSPNDLSRMNAAFFTVNGYISLLFLLFWGAAVAVAH